MRWALPLTGQADRFRNPPLDSDVPGACNMMRRATRASQGEL